MRKARSKRGIRRSPALASTTDYPVLDAELYRKQTDDVLLFDRAGPLVRQAIRELCSPLTSQLLRQVLSSPKSDAGRAAYVRSLEPQGVAIHWRMMEQGGDALRESGSRRLQRK